MTVLGCHSRHIQTNDGVTLHYLEAGSGPPLVMIPGWSQTAEQFKYQLEALSDRYHCIAIDMRGHGESEKVNIGYKIQRLAKDLDDVLTGLDLTNVAILGHSMGASVIWCYWDLFGAHRLANLILVDEPPVMISNPLWLESEREVFGATWTCESLQKTCSALEGAAGETMTAKFIGGMLTIGISAEQKAWIIGQNLKFPREYAARLLKNKSVQDWRDVIPRISVPTLVIGGKASHTPWKSQAWIHNQIPKSELVLFEEDEGGHHFMFISCPEKFNQVVASFLGSRRE